MLGMLSSGQDIVHAFLRTPTQDMDHRRFGKLGRAHMDPHFIENTEAGGSFAWVYQPVHLPCFCKQPLTHVPVSNLSPLLLWVTSIQLQLDLSAAAYFFCLGYPIQRVQICYTATQSLIQNGVFFARENRSHLGNVHISLEEQAQHSNYMISVLEMKQPNSLASQVLSFIY